MKSRTGLGVRSRMGSQAGAGAASRARAAETRTSSRIGRLIGASSLDLREFDPAIHGAALGLGVARERLRVALPVRLEPVRPDAELTRENVHDRGGAPLREVEVGGRFPDIVGVAGDPQLGLGLG